MNDTFKEKLISVQSKLKAPKSQYNQFSNFNYRSAEDILEAVKPILSDEGLVLTLSDEIVCLGERYYIKATATLSDGTDGVSVSSFAREDESRPGMSESQVTGCSSSYARKYALNGLFCIDDGKDSDSFDNRKASVKKTSAKVANEPAGSNIDEKGSPDRVEALKAFCGALKSQEGTNKKSLKKFYEFYIDKIESFHTVNFENLWKKWSANEREE